MLGKDLLGLLVQLANLCKDGYFSHLDKWRSVSSLTSATGKPPKKFSSKFASTFGRDPTLGGGGGVGRGRCSKEQLGKPDFPSQILFFSEQNSFVQNRLAPTSQNLHQRTKIHVWVKTRRLAQPVSQRFLLPPPHSHHSLTFSSSSLLGAQKHNESNGEQLTKARASGIKDEPQGQECKRAVLGAGAGASGSLHFHGRHPAPED